MRFLATTILVLLTSFLGLAVQRPPQNPVEKWQSAEQIQPEQLIVKVRDNGPAKPVILFVGFQALYRSGHIPGAVFAGPASTAAGIETLKHAVEKVSKDREVVIYCACCPWQACPNVRPAIELLHGLGYKQVKGLVIPSNLEADWTSKGYPLDMGEK
jgi:thiosulfate/3-mercaptopyruvate sulfurtransferase